MAKRPGGDAQTSGDLQVAWPDSCGVVDVLRDRLFGDIPYLKGAFFLRALERRIGADVLDASLRRFYGSRVGQAAGMRDLLDTVSTVAGYDPTACADAWLRSDVVPASDRCP